MRRVRIRGADYSGFSLRVDSFDYPAGIVLPEYLDQYRPLGCFVSFWRFAYSVGYVLVRYEVEFDDVAVVGGADVRRDRCEGGVVLPGVFPAAGGVHAGRVVDDRVAEFAGGGIYI